MLPLPPAPATQPYRFMHFTSKANSVFQYHQSSKFTETQQAELVAITAHQGMTPCCLVPMFQKYAAPDIFYPTTMVPNYQITRRHIQKDTNYHSNRCEHLKSLPQVVTGTCYCSIHLQHKSLPQKMNVITIRLCLSDLPNKMLWSRICCKGCQYKTVWPQQLDIATCPQPNHNTHTPSAYATRQSDEIHAPTQPNLTNDSLTTPPPESSTYRNFPPPSFYFTFIAR